MKGWLAVGASAAWFTGSLVIALPWMSGLAEAVTFPVAAVLVALVALIPGLIVSLMAATLLLDRQAPMPVGPLTAPVTVLVAAHNEADTIVATLEAIGAQDYEGDIAVIVASNNSADATAKLARRAGARIAGIDVQVIEVPTPGKPHALNAALKLVNTDLVATVDADTMLHPQALRRMVARMTEGVAAVAATPLAANPDTNLLTRMQAFDYSLGIASVKRFQSAYGATLVAQGAASVYDTGMVREVGGWPDMIGEDIVLTWGLLKLGDVVFEPTALAFTTVPDKLGRFMTQRSRWARGMGEGLATVKPHTQPRRGARLVSGLDYLVPLLDVGYAILMVGVLLAAVGIPALVGVYTLAVLPITFAMYATIRRYNTSRVLRPLGLEPQRDPLGFALFLFGYQVLASAAALRGYAQFLAGTARVWA